MDKKKIAVVTTGGDCSGLNTILYRLIQGCSVRGWDVVGIHDGLDGLVSNPQHIIPLNSDNIPMYMARISGSYLQNGEYKSNAVNLKAAIQDGREVEFVKNMTKSVQNLGVDALVMIGGNGSVSMAYRHMDIYRDVQLICIPKTIDMDVPSTDLTIGFETAVSVLTQYVDDVVMSARSHHRWFIVETMGRDVGYLALNAGIACLADAIIIPEVAYSMQNLHKHLLDVQKRTGRDWGVILVAEGVESDHLGISAAERIAEYLSENGMVTRHLNPMHLQRGGDTVAGDRILASQMAATTFDAIESGQTNMVVVHRHNKCETVSIPEMFNDGTVIPDPNVPSVFVSNAYVTEDNTLLKTAMNLGIYIGEIE